MKNRVTLSDSPLICMNITRIIIIIIVAATIIVVVIVSEGAHVAVAVTVTVVVFLELGLGPARLAHGLQDFELVVMTGALAFELPLVQVMLPPILL